MSYRSSVGGPLAEQLAEQMSAPLTKQQAEQLPEKEYTVWCMSNPKECQDYSPGEPERVLGEPYEEDPEIAQASATDEPRDGKLALSPKHVVAGIAVLAAGGILVYLFTKKKRR